MGRYSSYGSLDDRVEEDGDRFFTGFSNRLRPDQLEPGVLADSQNARIGTNGEWQVRKGINELLSPVVIGTALKLPFTLPTAGQIGDGTTAIIDDNVVELLYGSCPFTDPNIGFSEINQYIVIATNAKAFALNLLTNRNIDIGYPSGVTVTSSVEMLQAFNKVVMFRGSSVGLENSLRISNISAAALSSNEVTVTTSSNHNLSTGDLVTISNLTGSDLDPNPNGSGKSVTYISDTQFKYSLTGGNTTYTVTSNPAVATDFTKVSSGAYTQPTPIDVTDCDVASGVATCTASSGDVAQLTVGDEITVSVLDASHPPSFTVGETFVVSTIPSTTTFTFLTTEVNQSNKVFTCDLPISVAGGYIHQPAAPFGHYHQRRLVLPYIFKPSGSAGSETYTYRKILDEAIFSDILDSNTYDPIYNQFRFNAGKSDRIMGFHSFSEDTLIVFNRNSIHMVEGTEIIKEASSKLLTEEVGLIAKNSIEQVGNQIIFLSDNGVYAIGFIEDYKLRGLEIPLSESIQKTINRINKANAYKAQSAYFDNRYYLALPLDSSTRNNAIIVYNFLNQKWESIDTVNNANFHITNMFVAGEGDTRGVYITNELGAINQIESRVDGYDTVVTTVGGATEQIEVKGSATTRQFTLGTLDRKKWKSFEMHVESSPDRTSDFNISAELENLDRNITVGTLSTFNGGSALGTGSDVSIRGRLGNPRAYGVQFTIDNTSGRPRLRAIKTDGIESFRTIEKAD